MTVYQFREIFRKRLRLFRGKLMNRLWGVEELVAVVRRIWVIGYCDVICGLLRIGLCICQRRPASGLLWLCSSSSLSIAAAALITETPKAGLNCEKSSPWLCQWNETEIQLCSDWSEGYSRTCKWRTRKGSSVFQPITARNRIPVQFHDVLRLRNYVTHTSPTREIQ